MFLREVHINAQWEQRPCCFLHGRICRLFWKHDQSFVSWDSPCSWDMVGPDQDVGPVLGGPAPCTVRRCLGLLLCRGNFAVFLLLRLLIHNPLCAHTSQQGLVDCVFLWLVWRWQEWFLNLHHAEDSILSQHLVYLLSFWQWQESLVCPILLRLAVCRLAILFYYYYYFLVLILVMNWTILWACLLSCTLVLSIQTDSAVSFETIGGLVVVWPTYVHTGYPGMCVGVCKF